MPGERYIISDQHSYTSGGISTFEAKRTRRVENYKVWKDNNHAISLSNIDVMAKINYNPVKAGILK